VLSQQADDVIFARLGLGFGPNGQWLCELVLQEIARTQLLAAEASHLLGQTDSVHKFQLTREAEELLLFGYQSGH